MITAFYPIDEKRNSTLKYAIICARFRYGKWIFVRHKDRNTWEIPAGHIEEGEHPHKAATRELFEETGATEYRILPLMDYSVIQNEIKTFGRIYLAEVMHLGDLPNFEIAEISLLDELPLSPTYPEIQPVIFDKVKRIIQ